MDSAMTSSTDSMTEEFESALKIDQKGQGEEQDNGDVSAVPAFH